MFPTACAPAKPLKVDAPVTSIDPDSDRLFDPEAKTKFSDPDNVCASTKNCTEPVTPPEPVSAPPSTYAHPNSAIIKYLY